MKRAVECGSVVFNALNLRDFTKDVHRTTDDRPYGGGAGMIMKPEPLYRAIESVYSSESQIILLTPQGQPFNQKMAEAYARSTHLIFVCGHYEGVDERILELFPITPVSIGDYVLTNGVLPAAVMIDALVRLRPGVIGHDEATLNESFTTGLLEHPHYTRPATFKGLEVPEVLLSGNHPEIAKWRHEKSLERTRKWRPDLLSDKN